MGTIPKISQLHVQQLVQRSWSRIRDFRLWSFQFISDAQIFVPQAITAGAVTLTFNSTQVTVNAAAATAINAAALGPPPVAGVVGVGRQLRVGASNGLSSPTGPNYNISAWDGVNTLTLEKAYGETSIANTPYQIIKAYYQAPAFPFTSGINANQTPDANFIRFTSIINRYEGYSFRGKNLNWSQEMINAIDPQRGGQGDAYIQANYGRTPGTGVPVFELYPNPVNFTTYNACYITRWPNLSVSQDLPQMPYELADCVIARAKILAAQWALANVSTVKELGQTNWVAFIQMMQQEFKDCLIQCIKVDDELMPQQAYRQGSGFDFPLGGQFLQGHDVSSLMPS